MNVTTEVKATGGARIGMINATWPFATLKVSKDKLELNASILGSLVFQPADVISITMHPGTFSKGLVIAHRVPTYKTEVIFWTIKNPEQLLKKIEETGFLKNVSPLPSNIEAEILSARSESGTPIRKSVLILLFVIWNISIFSDFINFNKQGHVLGKGVLIGGGFIFLFCLAVLVLEPFQKLIMKKGRTFADLKVFVYFLMFLSGMMIAVTSILN